MKSTASAERKMDLLEPRYSSADLALLELMRSRLNVANALLDARLGLGLTQEQLANAAGTKQSRVSEIEAMKGNVRLDTLDRVSRAVGLMIELVPREAVQATAGSYSFGFQLGSPVVSYETIGTSAFASMTFDAGSLKALHGQTYYSTAVGYAH